jgi:hypothetical protein
LAAAFEQLLRSLGPEEHAFSNAIEKLCRQEYERIKERDAYEVEVGLWLSVNSFVKWFYQHYGPDELSEQRVFRHGIQHGTQAPPDSQVEALRLFNALHTGSNLYRRQEHQ